MVELEIDGQKVEVPEGSMVMEAASRLGLYVPHFCYHKKLSIAANCRMCLVEVEKAPKPLPACATPVTAGMKVFTRSDKARQAQKGVMEFLLINHPLDCPICDQGGECQLQDLAVGYGPSASRYTEQKRVVFHKPMGPLISAEEMSRCIHCTRCVRFGQEIAGVMELGMAGRGEHSEIMSFVGQAVQSELSGNMIDICPVGALTSKPFRYSARTWELSRRRSVSPHDSIGANLVVQSKGQDVKRVVPFENEQVNECWISDRDRFSYEALDSSDRLTVPMLRGSDGQWREAGWEEALGRAAQILKAAADHGKNRVRTLVSPNSSFEELFLAAKLTRSLNSDSVDFRPRLTERGFDQHRRGTPNLGMPLAQINHLERAFVVGSVLRQEHPLLAQRLRQAVRHAGRVAMLHAVADQPLMPVAESLVASPLAWADLLAQVAVAAARLKEAAIPEQLKAVKPCAQAQRVAQLLAGASDPHRAVVLLGNSVMAHPRASTLWANAQLIAQLLGCRLGFTVEGGNGVGGYLAGATPIADGHDAASLFSDAAEAYVLLNIEPTLDCADPHQARLALRQSKGVIALSAFKDSSLEFAQVALPIAPFTETSGSYVNCEGRLQSVVAVVRPRGEARPAWKVLRVLGNLVQAEDFNYESSEDVRRAALGLASSGEVLADLSFACAAPIDGSTPEAADQGLVRFAEMPIYRSDGLVRHAAALQQMPASAPPKAHMNPADLQRLGLAGGAKLRLSQQGRSSAVVDVVADASVAAGVVRLPGGYKETSDLGAAMAPIHVEAA